jgi:hypothetical protein
MIPLLLPVPAPPDLTLPSPQLRPETPLFTLPASSQPHPPSPYWIPLAGSSGSISPSSILVRMMRASRSKSSSTCSPLYADTSTRCDILWVEAHVWACSRGTSRAVGVCRELDGSVRVWRAPRPRDGVEGVLWWVENDWETGLEVGVRGGMADAVVGVVEFGAVALPGVVVTLESTLSRVQVEDLDESEDATT